MFTYAVDIMGGDLGPRVALKACKRFLRFRRDVNLIVTTTAEFEADVRSAFSSRKNSVRILVCNNAISMADKPAQMLRSGLTSTMAAALSEVAEGRAQGMVSAGNTGALLVLGRHILGMIPGIDRPALATLLPTRREPLLMLDLGANLSASPEQLVQCAALQAISRQQCRIVIRASMKVTISTRARLILVTDGFAGNITLKASEG